MLGLAKFALFAGAMFGINHAAKWGVDRSPLLALVIGLTLAAGVAVVIDPCSRTREAALSAARGLSLLGLLLLLASVYDAWGR